MQNSYIKKLVAESRIETDFLNYTNTDYTDTLPMSTFLQRCSFDGVINDEDFNFDEFSGLCVNLYRLFLTIEKLGGVYSKEVVRLIIDIDRFTSIKTNANRISLVQNMLKLMITQLLGNTLTSKPKDLDTNKIVVYDKEDKGKDYSDKYFSFSYNGKRYTVKTDTFDLSDIFQEL